MTLLWRVTLAALWLLAGCLSAAAESRVALIIGNSAYQHVGALENPVNDAADIGQALEGLGFDVLLGLDQSDAALVEITQRFADAARSADVALFYYAGHGFQLNGENYLVPVDAAISSAADIASQTVPLNRILNAMEQSKGIRLVFLDACRDNPFGEGLVPGAGEGLARVGSAADFLIAYATQPDNVAYDGTGRNSFFTEAMLNHIYTPSQDIADLMISVRKDVLAGTGGRQIPWENSSLTRQFRFNQSPPTANEETLLYQVAVQEGDPALMQLYVERYPDGAHAPDVVAMLDQNPGLAGTRALGLKDADEQSERLWQLAQRSRMRPLLQFYVDQYPAGSHVEQARRLLTALPATEDLSAGAICERLATHPRDATAGNAGVPFAQLKQNAIPAVQACSAAAAQSPNLPHYEALLARATAATGDMARAVTAYQQAAAAGDLRAMVSLAQLYETGTGLPQDPGAAVRLYEQAAAAGFPDAMINLAVILTEGTITAADPARAVALLRQAADQGSAKALYNLGVLAQEGKTGTPEEARGLFRRAAEAGEPQAWRAAAVLMDEGQGGPADPAAAADLLLRGAAEDDGAIVQLLSERSAEWAPATIAAVQERLKAAGLYDATVDGRGGPKFAAALTGWRNGGFDARVLAP